MLVCPGCVWGSRSPSRWVGRKHQSVCMPKKKAQGLCDHSKHMLMSMDSFKAAHVVQIMYALVHSFEAAHMVQIMYA